MVQIFPQCHGIKPPPSFLKQSPAPLHQAGVHTTRRNSGLENMTSIEQALADVNGQSGAHAVMEAAAQEFVRQQLTGHKRQSSRPLP